MGGLNRDEESRFRGGGRGIQRPFRRLHLRPLRLGFRGAAGADDVSDVRRAVPDPRRRERRVGGRDQAKRQSGRTMNILQDQCFIVYS